MWSSSWSRRDEASCSGSGCGDLRRDRVPDQLRERFRTTVFQYSFELRVGAPVREKIVAVSFAQAPHERITVLTVNLTVLVAVPFVEAGLFHARDHTPNTALLSSMWAGEDNENSGLIRPLLYGSIFALLHKFSYVPSTAAKASVICVRVVGADFPPSLNDAPDW